jgi:hypothetical protein
MQGREVTIHHQGAPFETICDILAYREPIIELLIDRNLDVDGVHLVLEMLEDIECERTLLDAELDDVLDLTTRGKGVLGDLEIPDLIVEGVDTTLKRGDLILDLNLRTIEVLAFVLETLLIFISVIAGSKQARESGEEDKLFHFYLFLNSRPQKGQNLIEVYASSSACATI